MDVMSKHLDDAQPSAEGKRTFARLGDFLVGRLVGGLVRREPGFNEAEMRALSSQPDDPFFGDFFPSRPGKPTGSVSLERFNDWFFGK
jgi:hypothetical protein